MHRNQLGIAQVRRTLTASENVRQYCQQLIQVVLVETKDDIDKFGVAVALRCNARGRRAFRDAVIAIMAPLAKQERVRRSERTKAGLARVKASGKRLGRPVRLNGEHHAAVARLRAQGVSFRAIARQLGISLRSAQRLAA